MSKTNYKSFPLAALKMESSSNSYVFLIVLPIISFVFLSYVARKTKQRTAKKLPPGPRKLPFIGNLHNLSGSLPHRILKDLAKQYGPLMHLQLGEVPAIVVSSPTIAREVMKTQDHVFAQRPELLASKILSYDSSDLVFAKGEYWKQLRKICLTELLGPKKVKSFAPLRHDEVSNLLESVRSAGGSPVNLTEKIFWMTNAIAVRAAFGNNKWEDQKEIISIARESLTLAGGFDLADLYPTRNFLHVLTKMKPRLEKMRDKVDAVLNRIVVEHKERIESGQTQSDDEVLVDVLLRLQGSGQLQCPMTIDNVKAVIWDMFVAGTDTSSTTTEWALSELIKNPTIMKKVQAEVRQMGKEKGTITEEDVQDLPYLKLVIKETLRLHPPVPLLLPRESKEDSEIEGYYIPEKTKVIVNFWAIGRDSTCWENPESFIPERFSDNSIDFRGTNFSYLPFGAGRRICPGMTFGLANVEFPLAKLLYHFDFKLPNGLRPEDLNMEEAFGATVGRKNGLTVIATPYVPPSY